MKTKTKTIPLIARLLFGGLFLLTGLNGFLKFMPNPPMPAEAGAFIGAVQAAGYLIPLVKVVEVVAGGLLLGGAAVPFALTMLAPVVVNVAAFHVFLAPAPGLVALLLGLEFYLAWVHRTAFAPLFRKASTGAASAGSTSSVAVRDARIPLSTGV